MLIPKSTRVSSSVVSHGGFLAKAELSPSSSLLLLFDGHPGFSRFSLRDFSPDLPEPFKREKIILVPFTSPRNPEANPGHCCVPQGNSSTQWKQGGTGRVRWVLGFAF